MVRPRPCRKSVGLAEDYGGSTWFNLDLDLPEFTNLAWYVAF